jgi:ribosomal protein S18 acetylase RimI-like enzyme
MEKAIEQNFVIASASQEQMRAAADLRQAMAFEGGEDWDANHPGWRDRYAEYFARKQAEYKGQLFVALNGEQVIAMAAVTLPEDYHAFVRGRISGRVNSVYVVPAFRRRGIARALMQAGMSWLKAQGCAVVRLNSSEEGLSLYRSLGFQPRRELEFHF